MELRLNNGQSVNALRGLATEQHLGLGKVLAVPGLPEQAKEIIEGILPTSRSFLTNFNAIRKMGDDWSFSLRWWNLSQKEILMRAFADYQNRTFSSEIRHMPTTRPVGKESTVQA